MIRRHPLVAFFLFAYGISWVLWAPLWLPALGVHGLPVLPYHHALGALGPIAAAFLVSAVTTGAAGPRDLRHSMVAWHGRTMWIAVALLGPVALLGLAALIARGSTGDAVTVASMLRSREFPAFGIGAIFLYNVFTFGYGEEVGWRGFALPRLQARHSALVATLLLTAGWALWHVPLFLYRPGYVGMGLGGALAWLFSLVTGSLLLTWLYNESRGSLLVVALFHASIDVVFTSQASTGFVVNAVGVMVTIWGLTVLVTTGPRDLSRHGKVVGPERGTLDVP